MKIKQNKSRKKLFILLAVVVVAVLVGGFLITRKTEDNPSGSSAKTTSTVSSAQPDFTSDDTVKSTDNASPKDKTSGVITDTNGAGATSGTSGSTSSLSGEIVVNSPVPDAEIANGATISGTSSLSKVYYRIVDTEVGVISTGSLNVVKGKFSGSIQFQTNAAEGKLDFFGTQSDGNEFSNVSIPVRFR